MNAREAREHLEMVDRILATAQDEPVRVIPGLIIVWGFAAAAIDVGNELYLSRSAPLAGAWLIWVALAIGVLYSTAVTIALARNNCYSRVSTVEKRMGQAMGAVWFTVLVAAFAQPHVFAGWGGAAVWSMGAAIMMLMVGFAGDRRGVAGGLLLLGSVLAANYALPHVPGYVLAAGFVFGYALPGLLFLAKAPRGEA
jgi:hypothetical protein